MLRTPHRGYRIAKLAGESFFPSVHNRLRVRRLMFSARQKNRSRLPGWSVRPERRCRWLLSLPSGATIASSRHLLQFFSCPTYLSPTAGRTISGWPASRQSRPTGQTGECHPDGDVERVQSGTGRPRLSQGFPWAPSRTGQGFPCWPGRRSHVNKPEIQIATHHGRFSKPYPWRSWPSHKNRRGRYTAPVTMHSACRARRHSEAWSTGW